MQYPNQWLKNPKTIAEQAPYRFIPRRSRCRGIPNFNFIEYDPPQEQVHHQNGRFYNISPGRYLFDITELVT
jgi:hypothetical protein